MQQSKFYQIKNVTEHEYTLVGCDGSVITRPIRDIDKTATAFTIQDAKDGDVLACPNDAGDRDVVFIFKNINSDEGWVFCFCAIDANGCFCTNNDYVGNSNSTNISPATKEQRDTLEKSMADAGYTFDFAKKELKKLSQQEVTKTSDQVHVHTEWHREDEQNLNACLGYIPDEFLRRWLTDVIHVKYDKHDWSEEDEKVIHCLEYTVKHFYEDEDTIKWCCDWLKSLKDRYTQIWKPSKEQIEALESATENCAYSEYQDCLRELIEQLKKLREE